MPLHDVLEGRYPATATLQNAHADAAARGVVSQRNPPRATPRSGCATCSARAAPYSGDVIAIALDDDQGAYLDNDTWPAPHWHAYVDWLRSVVRGCRRLRAFRSSSTRIEMKVTAAAPAWAWGDWYQSDAYSHRRARSRATSISRPDCCRRNRAIR